MYNYYGQEHKLLCTCIGFPTHVVCIAHARCIIATELHNLVQCLMQASCKAYIA